MSWGAVIVGAASVVGGAISANGAKKGGDAAAQGNMAAIAEQRRQYDQTRADMEPWRVAGADGLNRLNALLANPDSIQDSAAYQWRIGQGVQGMDRSAAARGALYSGGQSADLMRFGQGLASQEYGEQWNRLAGLAGVGQSANSQLGALGANAAGNIGNAYANMGNARASAYGQQAQAWNNALGGVVGSVGYGMGNNWGRA